MSANYENLETESYISGANLNGQLYRLVKLNSSGTVELSTAAADRSVGILAHDPKRSQFDSTATTGDAVPVAKLKGKVPMVASEAIAVGNFVVATTSGEIADAGNDISAITANSYVLGVALELGAADKVILVDAEPFFNAA